MEHCRYPTASTRRRRHGGDGGNANGAAGLFLLPVSTAEAEAARQRAQIQAAAGCGKVILTYNKPPTGFRRRNRCFGDADFLMTATGAVDR
jgi:hypothetical protein